mmetsp:Transcript_34003/g.72187  ORF Transcript_34003/g.72187 Transcript_34003/m.72187 type:complete len:217 (+) Transcript_34003:71-721(+)|eukprot:CAMPEP_0204323390 /NCGR_PEP_ID=MMETSP0469-20131031/9366_1 /ASSEMBLY_ACC=CAM_ASM_000384 /TAXON_ID=2969 /ORGANISM="Oxyrrhis marina" /LENGTH=216 /DNA_ID=CAMNT_0051304841 /DNA_START=61 /DNA_END=711 /DNA_ORIENTATION=+
MDIFLFVLGYYIHFLASCLLMYKIYQTRSIWGLSVDTQIAFGLSSVARCIWVLDTRLVETVFAYIELVISTVVALVLCYLCNQYYHTTTKHAQGYFRIWVIAPVALALAFLFHPGDQWLSMQVLVAFTMYLECLGVIPQLDLMRRMAEIEPLTSHYVGLLVIARAARMVFWGVLFYMGEHFLQLFIADLLHTILTADYMYLWFKKLRSGGALVYSI